MYDGVDALQRIREPVGIADVTPDEFDVFWKKRRSGTALVDLFDQRIIGLHAVAAAEKRTCDVTSDEASPASDENGISHAARLLVG
jgi:hypothetical protein